MPVPFPGFKNLIDVGEIGNASTGDIIFDGGEKINDVFKQLYSTFSDQRLETLDNGEGRQYLHATGYYQKPVGLTGWSASIQMGEQRDVDTTGGSIRANVAAGKEGEGIVIINSNGSLGPNSFLELQVTGSFVNVPSGTLKITAPYSKVTVWCISTQGGIARWDYSIENMFGNKLTPLDKTYSLSNTKREIVIANHGDYQSMKLLCTAQSSDLNLSRAKSSEINLFIDAKEEKVYSTEYAVIRKGNTDEEDEIYSLEFGYNATGGIIAIASSTTQNMQLAIKVIATQTLGVPL